MSSWRATSQAVISNGMIEEVILRGLQIYQGHVFAKWLRATEFIKVLKPKAPIKRSLGPKSQLKDPVLLHVWYCDSLIMRITLHHCIPMWSCDVADRWMVGPCSLVEDCPGAKLGISQVHIHPDMRHTSFFKATTPLKSPRPLSRKYSENHLFWSYLAICWRNQE